MGSLEIIRLTLQRGAADGASRESRALAERVTATAQRAALSAKSLIQRLLAFGRQQPLAPTTLDVNALVVDMTEIIDRALGATIVVETALADGGGWSSPTATSSKARCSISSSTRATRCREGGRLTHRDRQHRIPRERPRRRLAPGAVCPDRASVDTGSGIAPSISTACSSPSSRPRTPARVGPRLVDGLWVREAVGRARSHRQRARSGTTVRIYLPRSTSSEAEPARPP